METAAQIAMIGSVVYVVVEMFKKAGLPARFAGITAIFVGGLIGMLQGLSTDWVAGIVAGILGAGTAMGVYSGAKSTFSPELK